MKLLPVVATLATLALAAPAQAAPHATPHGPNATYRIAEPVREVPRTQLRSVMIRRDGHARIRLSNGARWNVRPCRFEDSPRCFWDAGTRGNHRGTSFIRLNKRTYWLAVS